MRDDVANEEDGGTAIDFFDQRGKIVERADHGLRIRPRHPREYANRGFRRSAGSEQPRATDGAAVMPI